MKDSNVVKPVKKFSKYIIRLAESRSSKGVYFMLYERGIKETYYRGLSNDYFRIFACTPLGTGKEYLTHIVEVKYDPPKRIKY